MTAHVIRRLIQALVVLIIVSVIVFLAMHFLPGDPIMIFVAQSNVELLTETDLKALRHEFGLDKPLPVQYINWLGTMLHGDFGTSIVYRDKVSKQIAKRLPITIHVGILAFILGIALGILGGTIAAIRRGKWLDSISSLLAIIGITIPIFWLGILMIYFFGFKLGWLPIQGYTSPFEDFWLSIRQLIMPVICLSVIPIASTARQTRSSMLEVIHQDYVRTAWSKGLKEKDVIVRHTIKNSLIPVITLAGMHIPIIVGGSVLIETVFNIPGMGRLMVSAVLAHDLPVVRACFLILATVVILTNLLVDLSYPWLDPRIRYN